VYRILIIRGIRNEEINRIRTPMRNAKMAPALNYAGISPEIRGERAFTILMNARTPMSTVAGHCNKNRITVRAGRPGSFP